MIQKFKILLVLVIASAGTLALFSSPTAFAQGESWKLTTKTTIVVSGGVFSGQNGNPSSVTLTLQNPNVDPAIWVNSSSFNLKYSNGTPLESRPRESGQFCITTLNTPSLINNRTTVSFKPIHRDDCNKGAQARYVESSNMMCGGATSPWSCNTLWQTSANQHISPDGKVTYNIAGSALKCGDPGFVGPCQAPYNPATADCAKTDGTPGQAEKCEAIKACITKAGHTQAECTKGWDDCINSFSDKGAGYNTCKTAVAKGDFTARHIEDQAAGNEKSCAIDGVGWIICPIANFMAGIVDAAYSWIATLLNVPPLNIITTDKNNHTYQAWIIMRNFANIAFVIAFLIIIFSQLTSIGLNNYGIKKMLPRLIVAAILVNVSYFICAIAVDISNILGKGFYGLFVGVENQIPLPNLENVGATGEGWAGLAGWAIAGGATVGTVALLGPSILLPALVAALLAIVTVFLVLTLRQALIVILIFVSPLAFVAYLLPNTESLFKKWKDLFQTLLLMYPIIAIIFGASAVASKVVMASSPTLSVQIMGALVAIIPLAITPVVMKTAGGVLNRFGGFVNNPNKGPFDRMRKSAQGYRDYRKDINKGNRLGRGSKILEGSGNGLGDKYSRRRRLAALISSGGATKAVDTEQKRNFAKAVSGESAQEYFAKRALGEEGFAGKITGDEKKAVSLQASSQNAVDKLEADSVKSREVLLRAKFDPRDLQSEAAKALEKAIKDNDITGARAAQSILLTSGAPGLDALSKTLQAAENSSQLGDEVSASLRKDINGAGLKGRDNTLATWSYTNANLQTIIGSASTYAGLSDKELVGQSKDNLVMAVQSGVIDQARADALLKSDNLGADFTAQKRAIIASIASPSVAAATPTAPTTPLATPTGATPTNPATTGTQAPPPTTPNTPPANPNTGRTGPPPGTSGGSTGSNGLWTP